MKYEGKPLTWAEVNTLRNALHLAAMEHARCARRFTIGYNMDLGGSGFEPLSDELKRALEKEDVTEADVEHFLCFEVSTPTALPDHFKTDEGIKDAAILIIDPRRGDSLPEHYVLELESGAEGYIRIAQGELYDSDHDCICHGKLVEWTGAAGEPKEPISEDVLCRWWNAGLAELLMAAPKGKRCYWETIGSSSDHSYPDCERCEGDGHVESPGCTYALYKRCSHRLIADSARIVEQVSEWKAKRETLELTVEITCAECGQIGSVAVGIDPNDVEW